ncbi:hypothetical protein HK102_005751 [Quaeritorhiza haematococci]|nr:hypothetical protein HK102_005751 [Quaeritorhiza haematococci]
MIVVINKIDLYPENEREARIEKMTTRLRKTLSTTRFSNAPILAVSANADATDMYADDRPGQAKTINIEKILQELEKCLDVLPERREKEEKQGFLCEVDHCFNIKGQGTVMTGTILGGSVSVGDTIEVPVLKIQKKVKSMQMFKKPVTRAVKGDRVGICVTQFDPTTMERGILATPGSIKICHAAVASARKIRFFKTPCGSGGKVHVTIGHETVMATITFFASSSPSSPSSSTTTTASHPPTNPSKDAPTFDISRDYEYLRELPVKPVPHNGENAAASPTGRTEETEEGGKEYFILLEFERPVPCPEKCIYIASKLDTDIHTNTCRIAFHGRLLHPIVEKDYATSVLPSVKIFKWKEKVGGVDRIIDDRTLIGKGLFKKETRMDLFIGLKVQLVLPSSSSSSPENTLRDPQLQQSKTYDGRILSSFGQSGKFKVDFAGGLGSDVVKLLGGSCGGGKKKGAGGSAGEAGVDGDVKLVLRFKRYVYDVEKKIVQ